MPLCILRENTATGEARFSILAVSPLIYRSFGLVKDFIHGIPYSVILSKIRRMSSSIPPSRELVLSRRSALCTPNPTIGPHGPDSEDGTQGLRASHQITSLDYITNGTPKARWYIEGTLSVVYVCLEAGLNESFRICLQVY